MRPSLKTKDFPSVPAFEARIGCELVDIGLIAYRKPLYQVLAIDVDPVRQNSGLQSVEQIFKRIGEGRS
ncbi:uncharacterized protein Dvar_41990 [Desulfosarcina variabilis str. Montpellier]